jgi:hypothetical protein
MTSMTDTGAIATVNLPTGWVAYAAEELPGRRVVCRASPYDRADVIFQSSVRGVELSAPARDAFMRTLYSPFHELNAAEIFDLKEVLEGFAEPKAFTVESAYTTYLNSRRIIYMSGIWPKHKLKSIASFIDLHGDSNYVQHIGLEAPARDFGNFSDLYTRDVLLSISWKSETKQT